LNAPSFPATDRATLARRGQGCLGAAVVGVLQGAALLAWPEQVSDTRFSFPLTATGHVIAQATFFLQHLPLVLAVAALAAVPAVSARRVTRVSLLVATAGLGLLALAELVAMAAATAESDSSLGVAVSSAYSVPVLLIGGGLTVAGIALLRGTCVRRLVAMTVLVLGAFVFIGLTPALASGSFVAGRLAIMAWMLLFGVLGWSLSRSQE
jgi:hypothetical protein